MLKLLDSFKLLAKKVLITLGLTAGASAIDAVINKKMFETGVAALIISNKEMNDNMAIVKALEESGLLTTGANKTIKMKQENKKADFSTCS